MSCDHRRTFLYGLLSMSPTNKAKIVIIIIMIIIRIRVAAIANKQQSSMKTFFFFFLLQSGNIHKGRSVNDISLGGLLLTVSWHFLPQHRHGLLGPVHKANSSFQ
jgi:hypothetical protein